MKQKQIWSTTYSDDMEYEDFVEIWQSAIDERNKEIKTGLELCVEEITEYFEEEQLSKKEQERLLEPILKILEVCENGKAERNITRNETQEHSS